MTAASINPQNTPTAESIQEALAFLRNLMEQKSTADDGGETEQNSFINPDILKTIEAALKSSAETKANADSDEDDSTEEDETTHGKRHAARASVRHHERRKADDEDEDEDDGDEDDEDDGDEDEDDNPFADDYYWCPGPEWKTIGLVAGGVALVGLGALLYKMLDD